MQFSDFFDKCENNTCKNDAYEWNIKDNDGIMLEPRLQEYWKKKQFFLKSNIETSTLDMQYNISQSDKNILKAYLSGKRDMYVPNEIIKYVDIDNGTINPYSGFTEDPDKMYKSDPRYKNYLKKVERENKAKQERTNTEYIDDMYYNNCSRGGRKIGYRNQLEHHFLVDRQHVPISDIDRGYSSRNDNYTTNNKK